MMNEINLGISEEEMKDYIYGDTEIHEVIATWRSSEEIRQDYTARNAET